MAQAEVKTIQVPLPDLYLAIEAPKGHDLVVRDSGRGSPLNDAELKASLAVNGVIRPLIFKAIDNKRYVISGNRRLRFLRELYAAAATKDMLVPVQNVADFGTDWRTIANNENMGLPPHLVERYEQIVMLTKELKLNPEEARLRFGMTPHQYRQVMTLGKMAPVVREAWRHGEIDVQAAQAYTLEEDPREQAKIFEALKKQRAQNNNHAIRSRILPGGQHEAGKLVAFVGFDVCQKAKIIKQEDLFGNHHTVTNMKALNKLVGDKLEATCKHLREACGWSWAMPLQQIQNHYLYGTLEPAKNVKANPAEQAELDRLMAIIESGNDYDHETEDLRDGLVEEIKQRGFSADQKAKSGCIVSIGHDGKMRVEYGKLKPEERKKVEAQERRKASDKKGASSKKDEGNGLSSAMTARLTEALQKAIGTAMVNSPHVAVSALIAAFASSGHLLDVSIGHDDMPRWKRENPEGDFLKVFQGAWEATPEARVVMLAKIAASALSIIVHNPLAPAPQESSKALQEVIRHLRDPDVDNATHANFDAENYFTGIPLAMIVEATREALGDEAAERVAKMKKSTAAAFAADEVTETGWLPVQLRTEYYGGPTAKAKPRATPAKKRAAKKKVTAKKGKK